MAEEVYEAGHASEEELPLPPAFSPSKTPPAPAHSFTRRLRRSLRRGNTSSGTGGAEGSPAPPHASPRSVSRQGSLHGDRNAGTARRRSSAAPYGAFGNNANGSINGNGGGGGGLLVPDDIYHQPPARRSSLGSVSGLSVGSLTSGLSSELPSTRRASAIAKSRRTSAGGTTPGINAEKLSAQSPAGSPTRMENTAKHRAMQTLFQSMTSEETPGIDKAALKVLIQKLLSPPPESAFCMEDGVTQRDVSPTHVKRVMEYLDQDADDMLDYEEFSRAFDLFMDANGQPSNFQTSLLAADSWALLAACHDYELDAQRAQDEFEIERARLEKEMSELRLKMQSRENESSRVLELASSDMDKMHSTVEQLKSQLTQAKSMQSLNHLEEAETQRTATPSKEAAPREEDVITREERDDLLMRVETLTKRLDAAERQNVRDAAELDETQMEMADTLEELAAAKRKNEEYERKVALMVSRLKDQSRELDDLRTANSRASISGAPQAAMDLHLEMQLAEQTARKNHFGKQIDALTKENESLRKKIEEMQEAADEQRSRRRSTSREALDMKASAELAAEQAEVQRLRGNLAATEAALRSARGKENRLEADLEALTAKLRAAPTPEDMASKIARVADLERALAAMRLSLNNMRSEQSRGESDSVAMLSRVRELEESIEAARRKDKTRMQENARLRRALVGLEEEIERLQNELGLKDKSEAQLRSELRRISTASSQTDEPLTSPSKEPAVVYIKQQQPASSPKSLSEMLEELSALRQLHKQDTAARLRNIGVVADMLSSRGAYSTSTYRAPPIRAQLGVGSPHGRATTRTRSRSNSFRSGRSPSPMPLRREPGYYPSAEVSPLDTSTHTEESFQQPSYQCEVFVNANASSEALGLEGNVHLGLSSAGLVFSGPEGQASIALEDIQTLKSNGTVLSVSLVSLTSPLYLETPESNMIATTFRDLVSV